MADINERYIENVQTLLTIPQKTRLVNMAKAEDKGLSEMIRLLILESLERWESSQPGRTRRRK